jgi:hypothetical protein
MNKKKDKNSNDYTESDDIESNEVGSKDTSNHTISNDYEDTNDLDIEFNNLTIANDGDTCEVELCGEELIEVTYEENIFAKYIQPAFKQAKVWVEPTTKHRNSLVNIITAFKDKNMGELVASANELGLNVYRCKTKSGDSFLFMITKKGKNNYNGPFLMLRETNPSKTIMIVPHNGSDGTNKACVVGFQKSRAFACVSNGYPHGISKTSDYVDNATSLGSIALRTLTKLYPKSVYFHVHGSSKKTCLYRCRNKQMENAYVNAIKKFTSVDKFGNFNAWYAVDSICDTNFYLKTEIPVRVLFNNTSILANVIKTFESFDWCNQ